MARASLLSDLPPMLHAYSQRHGIEPTALRDDGRMVLEVNERYRLDLRPAADGAVAVTARLLGLASVPPAMQDDLLLRLTTMATGLARDHAAGLVIDEARQTLLLQQVLPGTLGVTELEEELAGFANQLEFWSRVVLRESGRAGA